MSCKVSLAEMMGSRTELLGRFVEALHVSSAGEDLQHQATGACRGLQDKAEPALCRIQGYIQG